MMVGTSNFSIDLSPGHFHIELSHFFFSSEFFRDSSLCTQVISIFRAVCPKIEYNTLFHSLHIWESPGHYARQKFIQGIHFLRLRYKISSRSGYSKGQII